MNGLFARPAAFFLTLTGLLLSQLLLLQIAAADPAVSFSAQAPVTIMSTEDMDAAGLMIGDEPLGFVKLRDDTTYDVFTAGGSFSGVGRNAHLPPGTYHMTGTLDHLTVQRDSKQWPGPLLTIGRKQPSPDGSDFDRDYAGGGLTYAVELPGGASAQAALLQIYHGEYHFDKRPPLGYGGTGLALSRDGGRSFTKLGAILLPHLSRSDFAGSKEPGGLWTDAAMISADASGRQDETKLGLPIGIGGQPYLYFLLTDRKAANDHAGNYISLARVATSDFLTAVAASRVPKVEKYYNPTGAAGNSEDFYTEPGVGGASTPLFAVGPHDAINSPDVVYDSSIHKYLISFQSSQKAIVLRTSDDLLHWSEPQKILQLDVRSSERLFNPTLIGLGDNPLVPGARFYIYFLQRTKVGNALVNPRLQRIEVNATMN